MKLSYTVIKFDSKQIAEKKDMQYKYLFQKLKVQGLEIIWKFYVRDLH